MRWIALFLLVCTAGAALVLGGFVERVQHVEHQAPAARVQQNPFLAATRFLEQRGHRARHYPALSPAARLPDTDALLIVEQNRRRLDEAASQQLLDWVMAGGALVLSVRGDAMDPDDTRPRHKLLEQLDLEVVASHDAPPDPYRRRPFADHRSGTAELFWRLCRSEHDELRQQCISAMCGDPERTPVDTLVEHSNGEPAMRLEADSRWHLKTKGNGHTETDPEMIRARGGNRHGTQFLELAPGEGRLVLLTDAGIWNNERLHYLDHARLLAELSAGRTEARFISAIVIPSLHAWLWERAWPLILAALAMLAAWLWRRMPRRGPRLDPGQEAPKDFLAHLRAAGLLLWRRGDSIELLAPLRADIHAALQQRGIEEQQQLRHICEHTGLAEEQVRQALSAVPRERAELTMIVSTLQDIRKQYGNQ